MTIETKLNIGDTIWKMNNNKPEEFKVINIKISHYEDVDKTVRRPMTITDYYINCAGAGFNELDIERSVFLSKEELIKSL